ncbi:anti-repressor SinI family protein [Peribacillus sp. SI8-4]|nr:anti-repressor SinI family protein [Peribacillus sp. SI8-4]
MKTSFLDLQWVSLILEAKEIGLTPKEIRVFLDTFSNHQDVAKPPHTNG